MNMFANQQIEHLEPRCLLTAAFTGKLAIVDGTSRPDTITVQKSTSEGVERVEFQIAPKDFPAEGAGGDLSQTARVIVRASATRDVLNVDPALADLVDFVPDDTTGAHVFGATLVIAGGKGNDVIRVFRNRGQVNDISAFVNGQESQFSSATIKAIFIVGNRGNDDISIAKVNLPNAILGGDGDDSIEGGAEDDYISGELGADTVRSGAGNDQLFAISGGDLIDAGDGNDFITADGGATVLGGNGDDAVFSNAGGVQFTSGEGHDGMSAAGPRTAQNFTDFSSRRDRYTALH